MGNKKGENRLKCLVCTHKRRNAIEKALLRGQSYRNISARFGVSAASISRHKPHVAQAIAKAVERRDVYFGETLLDKLDRMELDFRRLAEKAELTQEWPSAIIALRETRETLKLIYEMQQAAQRTANPVTVGFKYGGEEERQELDAILVKLRLTPEAEEDARRERAQTQQLVFKLATTAAVATAAEIVYLRGRDLLPPEESPQLP